MAEKITVTDVLDRVNATLAAIQDAQETLTGATKAIGAVAAQAREMAAGAESVADGARSTANSASATAVDAYTRSGNAETAAGEARDTANQVLETVSQIQSAVDEAAGAARDAAQAAAEAGRKLDEAAESASNAARDANEAAATARETRDGLEAAKNSLQTELAQKAIKTEVDSALALKADKTQLPGAATQAANGLMSAADKKKLDGIAAGATATAAPPAAASAAPKAHGAAAVGTSAKYAREDHVHPSNNTDTHWTTHLYAGAANGAVNAATANGATYLMVLDNATVRDRRLIKGAGSVAVTSDANGNITITGTDTNTIYGVATQAANGLLSAADKKKLDGIAAGAQVNSNLFANAILKSGNITLGTAPAANKYEPYLVFRDSANTDIAFVRVEVDTAKNMTLALYSRLWAANGAWQSLRLQVAANGVLRAYLSQNPPDGENSGALATTAWGIGKRGARGQLAGSETAQALSNSQTININSADCINLATSGAVTLTFTAAAATVRAVKVICLTASAATTLTIAGAVWASKGSAPTWGAAGKILVLLAHFVGGRVVLSVIDNTQ